ncbi:hypothetical protein HT031_001402 [Scenedesmus sp. PABB004]|nr:hypothetical protein HT031_001402 [Scenedesmus sp. PABB004]
MQRAAARAAAWRLRRAPVARPAPLVAAAGAAAGAGGARSTQTSTRRRRRTSTAARPALEPQQQRGAASRAERAPRPADPPAPAPPPDPPAGAGLLLGAAPADPAFAAARGWVVFSDLHVSTKTVDTALQVLRVVHRAAADRGAGVLFLGAPHAAARRGAARAGAPRAVAPLAGGPPKLRRAAPRRAAGDFWDRRGDLPVVPLNRVQQELRSWEVPLLLLPGNHDQVDLGGQHHSLEPLTMAARAAHVFTHPTLYRDALWLPYRRDEAVLRGAIAQAKAAGPLKAIFGHADVLTARMNAAHQARDGLPPGLFPARVPVYLGHYHLPQTLPGSAITYVGSPFQVTSSEAGQQKRLLLLDEHWQAAGEVPLDVGRRFFTLSAPGASSGGASVTAGSDSDADAVGGALSDAASGSEGEGGGVPGSGGGGLALSPGAVGELLASGALRRGDVAHLRAEAEDGALLEVQRLLAAEGVQVQLHLRPPARAAPRIASAEQLSMAALLEQYAANTGMAPEVLALARQALQGLGSRGSDTPPHSHLQLSDVTVEGFGPFREPVTYPLAGRGVVAVTGRNEDDTAAASNGAGKTSLLTALLWAFKAPDGRGMTAADYVNEDSKRAAVTVTGTINGEPFELTRTVTGGRRPRSGLALSVGGEDLTCQEQRHTEDALRRLFSSALLPQTLVFTQEDLLRLLQSGDREFKEQLSCVVDTQAWDEAKEVSAAAITGLRQQLAAADVVAAQAAADAAAAADGAAAAAARAGAWEADRAAQLAQLEEVGVQCVRGLEAGVDAAAALQHELHAALAAAAARRGALEADQAAAAAAAAAAADAADAEAAALEERHRAELEQLQQRLLGGGGADGSLELPVFDESAVEARLAPLLAAEQALAARLAEQQGASQALRGQIAAVRARLARYSGITSGAPSGGARVAVAGAAAAAAGGRHAGGACGSPVCEQCLQPIDLQLYQRNLDGMAGEEAELQQQLAASREDEARLAAAHAAAQQDRGAAQQQHAAAAQEVRAARERLMQQQAEQQQRRAQAVEEMRRLEQRQRLEQQERQQRVWQEERRLQWELHELQQLTSQLQAADAQVASGLAAASERLQLPGGAAPARSCSFEGAAAAADDPAALEQAPQLCKRAGELSAALGQLADGVLSSRASRESLAGAVNPHASGVQALERGLAEQRRRVEETREQQEELTKQLSLWRRVDVAFGRTGVPSFILEDVLGELQAACSRHLGALAAGMALELSATSAKRTAPAAGKAPRAAKAAKAPAAPWDALAPAGAAAGLAVGGAAAAGAPPAPPPAHEVKEEISKIVRVRAAGGELRERSVAQLSGGEKKRVALALGLGFAELVAARSRLTSNVLVLDEVLEKLDEEGCACVAGLLKSLPYSSVFVVGQAGSFVTKEFACVDTVVKAGGAARVELGGGAAARA